MGQSLTSLDIEWVGLVFRLCPLKDSGNTSGGCRACAKLSIPPSTRLHRQLTQGWLTLGQGSGRMENFSRLQTWANLKYPSQESLETANSLRTSPPALSALGVQKDPIGSTMKILTPPRCLSPA